ncbi:hypothetical protein EV356DRAFT_449733 [Viridothelium virens]|uniref:PNPLA domain-containing protein n=1 Tax=Viridothelium virens TaxID=1048519 RepID=A0A6A6H5C1_VIRVR|nr:hypothetical protein EV356DRAFT_449733 [Viridothelium virens]
MLGQRSFFGMLQSISGILFEVAFFWQLRLYNWWTKKTSKELLFEIISEAKTFEEWEAAAFQLDEILGNDLWRQNPASKFYDYRLIYERLQGIIEAREDNDILTLVNLLRSGLVRNLGNITAPRLFNRAYAGTKLLIEDYITQVALAIGYVTAFPTSNVLDSGLNNQAKLDLLHDTRQAFGRSALVLQGGSIFGLCHLGVVKALHLRGLLPRIVAGTATGALIAALVGVHTEDELLQFLSGEGIDLSAFYVPAATTDGPNVKKTGWWATLQRRIKRFMRDGYFLDVGVLEQCVRANVGDITFEEAYARTKRVLNITVSTTGGGVPNLLNYLTAPNVLIWSAALASNAADPLYSPVKLKCKDEHGDVVPWTSAQEATFKPWTQATYTDRESPLARIGELFNCNHFMVSQARPYIAPFLRSDMHHPNPRYFGKGALLSMGLIRLMVLELQHRLHQLDSLGCLPSSIRRFLLDENIPGANLTVVPDLFPSDFIKLLENPTAERVNYWIHRGERSVWPAIAALKVRCAIEVELDRGYQLVRRRKPLDSVSVSAPRKMNESRKKARTRSLGGS